MQIICHILDRSDAARFYSNEFPIFFFPIVTDNDYVYQTTNSIGRVNFNNLCYGDDALIFVFGGSLETRSCSIFDEKIKIGSTDFMNVYTNCK